MSRDDDDELEDELLDDEVPVVLEPPLMEVSAFCTAAVSWVLTRFRAVWFAILAKPLASVLDAPNILSMTAAVCDADWVADEALLQ